MVFHPAGPGAVLTLAPLVNVLHMSSPTCAPTHTTQILQCRSSSRNHPLDTSPFLSYRMIRLNPERAQSLSHSGEVTQPHGTVTLPHSDCNQIIRYLRQAGCNHVALLHCLLGLARLAGRLPDCLLSICIQLSALAFTNGTP